MHVYSLLIFFHVLGAVGMFAALGIEAAALAQLRRSRTTAEARTWAGLLALPSRIGPITLLALLVTGVWMMARTWGPQPWIQASLTGIVVMAFVGGIVSRRGARRLREILAADPGAELQDAFRPARSTQALAASFRLRLAVATGILALMTTKPGPVGSLIILIAALAAGLLAIVPLSTGRTQPAGARS
jgi:hypothetical protein